MKKYLVLALFVLNAVSARAADSYSIDWTIGVKGEAPENGHLIVEDGDAGSIYYKKNAIKLTPTRASAKSVKIRAEILELTPKGLQQISTPTMVVLLGQPAQVSERSSKDGPLFDLKLVAKVAAD